MNSPYSTYRLQLHQQFNFSDVEENVEYFSQLGIGTLYVSPVLKSVPGSTHGYDGTDPAHINPELDCTIPLNTSETCEAYAARMPTLWSKKYLDKVKKSPSTGFLNPVADINKRSGVFS